MLTYPSNKYATVGTVAVPLLSIFDESHFCISQINAADREGVSAIVVVVVSSS